MHRCRWDTTDSRCFARDKVYSQILERKRRALLHSPPFKSSRFYKFKDLFFLPLKQKNVPLVTDGIPSLIEGAFCLQLSAQ